MLGGHGSCDGEGEDALVRISVFSQVVGSILAVGAVVALVPQHIVLWKRRNSTGLSYITIFLANSCQYCSMINEVLLKLPVMDACSEVGWWDCYGDLIAVFQLGGIWIAYLPVFVWFLLFFHHEPTAENRRDYQLARLLFIVLLVLFVVIAVVAVILVATSGECGGPVRTYAYVMGMVSVVLNICVWTPQICRTFLNKSSGALSKLTIGIQFPGSLVLVAYLIFASHESVSTWLSTFTASVQQCILLYLLIYYDFFLSRRKPQTQGVNFDRKDVEERETLSLLHEGSPPSYGDEPLVPAAAAPSLVIQ